MGATSTPDLSTFPYVCLWIRSWAHVTFVSNPLEQNAVPTSHWHLWQHSGNEVYWQADG